MQMSCNSRLDRRAPLSCSWAVIVFLNIDTVVLRFYMALNASSTVWVKWLHEKKTWSPSSTQDFFSTINWDHLYTRQWLWALKGWVVLKEDATLWHKRARQAPWRQVRRLDPRLCKPSTLSFPKRISATLQKCQVLIQQFQRCLDSVQCKCIHRFSSTSVFLKQICVSDSGCLIKQLKTVWKPLVRVPCASSWHDFMSQTTHYMVVINSHSSSIHLELWTRAYLSRFLLCCT